MEAALMFGAFGGIIYSIVNTTSDSTWIKQIIKYQCTDTYLQNIFLYYEHMIDQTSTYLVTACFLWGVLFVAHIIFFAVRNYIGDLYSKRDAVPEVSALSDSQQQLPL
jgi:large-conductance mechanosensitive channel